MHPGEQCDPFQNLIIIPKYQDAKMQERPNIFLGVRAISSSKCLLGDYQNTFENKSTNDNSSESN